MGRVDGKKGWDESGEKRWEEGMGRGDGMKVGRVEDGKKVWDESGENGGGGHEY